MLKLKFILDNLLFFSLDPKVSPKIAKDNVKKIIVFIYLIYKLIKKYFKYN